MSDSIELICAHCRGSFTKERVTEYPGCPLCGKDLGQNPDAKPKGPAQARTSLTVAERVDHCAELMANLQWERGKTARRLAAEWGLSVTAVEAHSAEASRRVIGDRDEAIRDITAGARKLFSQCVVEGDAKGAKAIGELWADVAGAKAPTKTEIDAKVSGPASPEQAARLVREKFGEHAANSSDAPAEQARSVSDTADE